MAQERCIAELLLRYQIDQASLNGVLRGNQVLREQLGRTAKQTLTVEDAVQKLNNELSEIARQRAIGALTSDMQGAVRQGGDLAAVLERASTSLAELGASDKEIRAVAEFGQ